MAINTEEKRYTVPDILRGIAVICMIIYHALWDLVFAFGVDIPWLSSQGAAVFQSFIRWSFIIISGFCWSMGRKKIVRALTVLLASAVITAVTVIIMPDDAIIFGVLTLLGSAMLLTVPLDKIFRKANPLVGLLIVCFLFLLTYNVKNGRLSLGGFTLCLLPGWLYANYFTAYLGFVCPGFSSSDYVPILPWIFLFFAGYFLYRIFERKGWLSGLSFVSIKPLEWIGRRALIIYMLHQPVVYGVLYLFFRIIKV